MGNNKMNSLLGKLGETAGNLASGASKTINNIGQKAGELTSNVKNQVVDKLDVSGNGEVDIEDFIILGLRTPGVGVNRESYLRSEFQKTFPQEVIDLAVESTPAKAGITVEQIDKLADHAIAYERNCVTGISAALGMPGGAAMAATVGENQNKSTRITI